MFSPSLGQGRLPVLTLCSVLVFGGSCILHSAVLDQNCVVAILNRTVKVNVDGTWALPNVPSGFGLVRARATCVNNGVTTFGQSAPFVITANAGVNVPAIPLGATTPVPTS